MGFDRTIHVCPVCGKSCTGIIAYRKHHAACVRNWEKKNDFKAPHFACDKDGDLAWLASHGYHYFIQKERTNEPDWFIHLFGKMVDNEDSDYALFGEFVAAFITWCARNGIKTLNVSTEDLLVDLSETKFRKEYLSELK